MLVLGFELLLFCVFLQIYYNRLNMKYFLSLTFIVLLFGCNAQKHTLFPDGVIRQERVQEITSEKEIGTEFKVLTRPQWQALFIFHYPDLVVPPSMARKMRLLPPRQMEWPIWVYQDNRRLISFTADDFHIHDLDDRMKVLFEYGFPDNIERFSRRDGVLEKWDYYRAGRSFTFLDGAKYRSTQY